MMGVCLRVYLWGLQEDTDGAEPGPCGRAPPLPPLRWSWDVGRPLESGWGSVALPCWPHTWLHGHCPCSLRTVSLRAQPRSLVSCLLHGPWGAFPPEISASVSGPGLGAERGSWGPDTGGREGLGSPPMGACGGAGGPLRVLSSLFREASVWPRCFPHLLPNPVRIPRFCPLRVSPRTRGRGWSALLHLK